MADARSLESGRPRRRRRRVETLLAAVVLLAWAATTATLAAPTRYRSTGGNGWVMPTVDGVQMVSKVVGTEIYVREVNSDRTPGDFAPFGFIAGINVGASKPYHDPGELALTLEDYYRVCPRHRRRRRGCTASRTNGRGGRSPPWGARVSQWRLVISFPGVSLLFCCCCAHVSRRAVTLS